MPAADLSHTTLPSALSSQTLPLRDIHLPAPISWWPPAPGWWLIAGTVIGIIVIYFVVKKIRYARRLKRATQTAFEVVKQQYLDNHNKIQLAQQLSVLLRRASISFYPRHNIAGLTGKNWLNFLDSTLPAKTGIRFNSKLGEILLSAPYMPAHKGKKSALNYDADTLLKLCRQWLSAQPVKHNNQKGHQENDRQKMLPAEAASSVTEPLR